MKTLLTRTLIVGALGFGAAACDSGNVTAPTRPAMVTDSFAGTIGQTGRITHLFEVGAQGGVTAQIIAVDPTDSAVMGFSLGVWNGTACNAILLNSAAQLGSALAGTANPSSMCVELFDVGNYAEETAVNYTVAVTHPILITVQ